MRHLSTASCHWNSIGLIAALVAFVTSTGAAGIVIHDDFNDSMLDPAWEVTLEHALGWIYEESGTNLTVTDIEPEIINPGGGGTWARVRMTRDCPALADLRVNFRFSWDCLDVNAAMQGVYVSLLDASGRLVLGGGISDAWIAERPCRYAQIGAEYECQWGELPFAGTGEVSITRTAEEVTVLWDDVLILSGSETAAIHRVQITFGFYARSGNPESLFGTESVDVLTVQDSPTPVAVSSWSKIKAYFR